MSDARKQFERKAASVAPEAIETKHITVPFHVKADAIDENARTFEGLASVWGLDLGDDVMHEGAFKETIKEWEKGADAIPLLNSHDHFDVMSAIGQLLEAKETKEGLWTKWEVIKGPDGDAILARLRPSTITGKAAISKMSIGYEAAKVDFEESDAARFGMVRHLRKVNLKEVSLVIFPMAPGARINVRTVKTLDVQSVKSFIASIHATDPQSIDDETTLELRRANTHIGNLMASKKTASATPPTSPNPAPTVDPPADPSAPSESPTSTSPALPATTAPTQTDPATPPAQAPAEDAKEAVTNSKTDRPDQLDDLSREALDIRLKRVLQHPLTKSLGAKE